VLFNLIQEKVITDSLSSVVTLHQEDLSVQQVNISGTEACKAACNSVWKI
jgi:hypothetical protein